MSDKAVMKNPFGQSKKVEIEVDSALLQRLMEIGFLATGCSLYKHAVDIFDGLRAVRPDNAMPLIGLGLCALSSGHHDKAVLLLREGALSLDPKSGLVKAFLGLALRGGGYNNEAVKVFQEVVEEQESQEAVAMAQALLNVMAGGKG